MAKHNYKISVRDRAGLASKVSAAAQKKVRDRMASSVEDAKRIVKQEIQQSAVRSRFFLALKNKYAGMEGKDIPAEFGLEPSRAESIYKLLLATIKKAFKIDSSVSNAYSPSRKTLSNINSIRLKVFNDGAVDSEIEQLTTVSENTSWESSTIHWGRWVIRPNNVSDISRETAGYGIKYGINTLNKWRSRSGRALMEMIGIKRWKKVGRKKSLKSVARRNLTQYTTPNILYPIYPKSKNVIDDIITDPAFVSNVQARIASLIRTNKTTSVSYK